MIARAATLSALHGAGTGKLGAELGVPATTVRGWLRRLRERAGQVLQEATAGSGFLAAVAACALAAIAWHGYRERDFGALTDRSGLAAALAPAPGS